MPYTLAKAFVWLLLAGVLGLVVGWLLRSVAARRQIARARSQHGDPSELTRLRAAVADLDAVRSDRDRLQAERDELRARLDAADADAADDADDSPDGSADGTPDDIPDDTASVVDDLKLIDGIGPSVEDLCHGIGIRTWADLAATEPSLLRTMLNDAGPRFKTQDPTTWPQQAALLAEGRWAEFRELSDRLRDGTPR